MSKLTEIGSASKLAQVGLESLQKKVLDAQKQREIAAQNYRTRPQDRGGFFGGVGYLGEKVGAGFMAGVEGVWDFAAGGIADIFGADQWAEEQIANKWFGDWYNNAGSWYNPSEGWQTAGNVAQGIGSSLPALIPSAAVAVGAGIATAATGGTAAPVTVPAAVTVIANLAAIPIAIASAGGQAVSEAYEKTGKLTGEEWGYGALVGVTEGGIEGASTLIGLGAGKIAKALTGTARASTSAAARTGARSVVSGVLRTAGSVAGDFASEALEEGLAEIMSPYYARATYDPNAKNATAEEVAYAAIVGGVAGVLLGGVGKVAEGGAKIVTAAADGKAAFKSGTAKVVLDTARLVTEAEENKPSGYKVFQQIAKDYRSLEDVDEDKYTNKHYRKLAELQELTAVTRLLPTIEESAVDILMRPQEAAERFAAIGVTNAEGNPITAEDLTAGLVGVTPNSAEGIYAIRKALSNNPALTAIAVADAAGKMMLQSSESAGVAARGISEEQYTLLQSSQNAGAIAQKLGLGESLDGVDYATFAKAREGYAQTEGGKKYISDTQRAIETAKGLKENTDALPEKVGDTARYGRYAIIKDGDRYRIYDYKTGNLSFSLSENQANEFIRRVTGKTEAKTEEKPKTEDAKDEKAEETTAEAVKRVQKKPANETPTEEKTPEKKPEEEKPEEKKPTKVAEVSRNKNGVTYEGFTFNEKNATNMQKATIAAAEFLHKFTPSVEVHVYQTVMDGDKRVVKVNGKAVTELGGVNVENAPNGFFTNGNHIYIDINATRGGKKVSLYTLSHEITHYIHDNALGSYNKIAKFLYAKYGKKGTVFVELQKAKQEALKKHYADRNQTPPDAVNLSLLATEELVADSMSHMLADESFYDVLEELGEQDATAKKSFTEALKHALEKLKGLLQGVKKVKSGDAGDLVADFPQKAYKQLQKLYAEAIMDAETRMGEKAPVLAVGEPTTDIVPVESVTKYSYRSLAEAAGFNAVQDENGRRFVRDNGETVTEVTVEDIDNSPIGAFINFSLEQGDITEEGARQQKELFAGICTMAAKTNDFGMAMQFVGSSIFTAMKTNADKQYGTSYDMVSICTKTQAVIDAMSAKMVKLQRGLTKEEILELYNEVQNAGNPVPCPECYVFSRWIGIGGLLDNIKSYQDKYGNMSVAEAAKAYREMRLVLEAFAKEQNIPQIGKAKGALTKKLTKEFNDLTEKIEKATNQGETVKEADRKRLEALQPMMETVKAATWLEKVYFTDSSLTKANPKRIVPPEILFDLNKGEIFATEYKAAWAFRTTQGAGYGKAITPYADVRLGEGVMVTNNTAGTIKSKANATEAKPFDNPFLKQKGTLDDKTRRALLRARLKQKIQAFLGGQRFQSTSDARYENASDYLLAALEMQAMHGMVQVYTKVDGAVPAFDGWGFSSNQSLMPRGGGLDANGNPIDTSAGGMNPEVAFENRQNYEHSGTITIGVNDNHIRALLEQIVRDFVIPYHASGGDANMVAEMRTIQDRDATRGEMVRSTDYTRTQSEKALSNDVLKWQGKTDEEIARIHDVRRARIAILTRGKPDMDVVRSNRFLSALYDKFNGGMWDGVKIAKSKVESTIYPNEFWDTTVHYEDSGKITKDYLEYCEDLGFLHKFSGLVPRNGELKAVTGYNEKGEQVTLTDLAYQYEDGVKTDKINDFYWKLIVDRRMYGNDGAYLPQAYVTLSTTTTETVTQFAKNNHGRQYDAQKSKQVVDAITDAKFSERDSDVVASDFVTHMNELLKERKKEKRGWYARDVFDYVAEHPELNFVERIYAKDKTAKKDLDAFLAGVNDVGVLDYLSWYMASAYRDFDYNFVTGERPYLGVSRTFANAIKKRINAIMTEKVGGTNLGVTNGDVTLDYIEDIFYRLNSNAEIGEFAKKVFATARTLGVNIRFANDTVSKPSSGSTLLGESIGDMVTYKTSYFNNTAKTDQDKAGCILHELIHTCTSYVLYENTHGGDAYWRGRSQNYNNIANAATRLNRIYGEIQHDPDFKGQYGLTNPREMVAELSDEEFVGLLRKKNLWESIVDWICELFGFRRGTSAYDNARMCVDYILDNPDVEEYKKYANEQRRNLHISGKEAFGSTTDTDGTVRYSERDDSEFADQLEWVGRDKREYTPSFGERVRDIADRTYAELFDAQIGIERGLVANGMSKQEANALVQRVRSSGSAAQSMLGQDQYNHFGGKHERVGEGLTEILKPTRNWSQTMKDEFDFYLLNWLNVDAMTLEARSLAALQPDIAQAQVLSEEIAAMEDGKEKKAKQKDLDKLDKKIKAMTRDNRPIFKANEELGRDHDITAEESEAIVKKLEEKHPAFKDVADKIYGYLQNSMQKRVDAGLVTQEAAERMAFLYPHYVPVQYDIENGYGFAPIRGAHAMAVSQTIRRAIGGKSAILKVADAIAQQTIELERAGNINILLNSLYPEIGEADTTQDADDVNEDEVSASETAVLKPTAGQITFFKNGERVTVKIPDGVEIGINDLRTPSVDTKSPIERGLARAMKLFREGVTTYSPVFTPRNAVRDIQDAGLNSKHARLFAKHLRTAPMEILKNSENWRLYRSIGAFSSSVFQDTLGAGEGYAGFESIALMFKDGDVTPSKLKKAFNLLGKSGKAYFKAVENVNNFVEQIPRFAEFCASLEAGDSVDVALYNSAEVTTNFGRHGKLSKKLNAVLIPFLNANLQGFDKMLRNVGDAVTAPQAVRATAKLLTKAVLVGMTPMLVNMLMYGDDDEYEALRDTDKENYFLIKVSDDSFIKIPRGRVASAIGGILYRGSKIAKGEDPDLKGYAENVWTNLSPVDSMSRDIFSPWRDVASNTTWYGSKIEGQEFDDTRPSERYDESTSSIAIALGKVFNQSPKKIHYLLDQYTGVVGDLILPATSQKENRGLFSGNLTIDSVLSNKWSTKFYELYDETNYKKTEGDESATYEIKYLNRVKKAIKAVNDEIDAIRTGEGTNGEKLQKVRVLRALVNEQYKSALDSIEAVREAIENTKGIEDETLRDAEITRIVFGAETAIKQYDKKVYEKYSALADAGVSYDDIYDFYFSSYGIESDTDKYGNVIDGSKRKKVFDLINAMDIPVEQKVLLADAKGYTVKDGDIKGVSASAARKILGK